MNNCRLCLVQFGNEESKHYLFEAPINWLVAPGAYCRVEDSNDIGIISNTMDIYGDLDSDIQRSAFVLAMNEKRPLKKITQIVSYETLEYEDVSE